MQQIWTRCKEVLRTKVNEHVMNVWFEPIRCEDVSENRMKLSVPNTFFLSWFKENNYLDLIRETLAQVCGTRLDIDILSRNETFDSSALPEENEETKIVPACVTKEYVLKCNLSPRFTFDNFVVGGCNQFAHAAARAVADNLGTGYNPLFIYGGVGLGKTHLMSAVGYAVLHRNPNLKVAFCTAEEFTNEVVNCLRFKRIDEFKEKYRNLDLLMMDDIQFLAKKDRTQEEFFHTFSTLYAAGKQIVITSDRFPNEIPDIEQRLKSRFSWGLIADMGVPDLETRVAILKRKALESGTDLSDEVSFFLAEHVTSNVRELEGYLIRIVAMSSIHSLPINMDLAQTALKEILHKNFKAVTIEDVIQHVSKAFNVKAQDVKSKKKHKMYSLPRQVGMYLARQLTELSYPDIGAAFGGKNHATVIYAAKKIENKMETDPSMRNLVEGIRKNIRE